MNRNARIDSNFRPTDLRRSSGTAERDREEETSARDRTVRWPGHDFRADGHVSFGSSDLASVLELLLGRWRWIVAGGLAGALAGLVFGWAHFKTQFSAAAQLVRYESPNSQEVFRPYQVSAQTFASLLHSPEVLQRVSARANPAVSAQQLAARLRVAPERNSDVVVLVLTGQNPRAVVDLANLFAREAVRYTQELQAQEAAAIRHYLTQQLAVIDREIRNIARTVSALPAGSLQPLLTASPLAGRLSERLKERLQLANDELTDLLATYTEAHPSVKAQRAKIAAIEAQLVQQGLKRMSGGGTSAEDAADGPSAAVPADGAGARGDAAAANGEVLVSKLQSLETGRLSLTARLQGAELFETQPAGYYRMLASATLDNLVVSRKGLKVLSVTLFLGLLGAALAALTAGLIELTDPRLKTVLDVQRVTGLPVLTTAGNFAGLAVSAQQHWAFRAWTAIQGRLCRSPDQGLVCGVTSSQPGEGRSTWVNLLAQAASDRGFRVLTIATQPTSDQTEETGGSAPLSRDLPSAAQSAELAPPAVLASPMHVTQQLLRPDPQPRVHIPLPGWVWNLERRKQWRAALEHWRQIDNIVILVELPPASVPETVLLAENLPNLIWLADSGRSDAGETRSQLESLQQARCRLVGAILNRAPARPASRWLPRWLAAWAVLLATHGVLGEGISSSAWFGGALADRISNLRILRPSGSLEEAVLTMDYSYDGANGLTARILAAPGIRKQKTGPPGFVADEASVSKGRGVVSINIRYAPADPALPQKRRTDRVTVRMVTKDGRTLLAGASLLQTLEWTTARVAGEVAPPSEAMAASGSTDDLSEQSGDQASSSGGESTVTEDQEAQPPAGSFSVSDPSRRAEWQRRLVLGPGDVLNVALFGQPELTRTNVFIGPDGRISFLEASDVLATGLTVDELRDKLNAELAMYRRAPQVILSPVEYRSKKYFVLGRVAQKGVFILDHPTTLIEAVARARGLETGLAGRSVVELADLTRAFLARRGQRANVNFEKLFLHGDLSQNIPLEPGDYLFFPPANLKETYVLGEVQLPGAVAWSPDMGAVAAISMRGGFTPKAWKGRVLVVRGSLDHPETFAVNAPDVLTAKATDIQLEPGDIVFVSGRPWIKAEEVLDAAAQAFVQAAVIIWTGGNIGPLIR